MFYQLTSILFSTVACETSHLNASHVCVSNASDMEFRLSIAVGNEMDMAILTLLISK